MQDDKLKAMVDQYYLWGDNPNGSNYYERYRSSDSNVTSIFIYEKKCLETECRICNKVCRKAPTFSIHWNFRGGSYQGHCSYCHKRWQPWKEPKD